MIYRKVEKVKEKISVIGIGCWNFGGDWDGSSDKNTENIIMAALDGGINFFDIAPVYGFSHSETVLAEVSTLIQWKSPKPLKYKGFGLLCV